MEKIKSNTNYKFCSKSNASHFMMLVHNIKGECWYVSRAESSCQYSDMFCCCVTDGSRRAVWQNGVCNGSVYEAKVCHWIPPCGKHWTHWCSLMLAECLQRPTSGCGHREVVGDTFQQWGQWYERQATFWMGMHSYHIMKWKTFMQISRLRSGNCVQSSISASMHWKQWWQHWNTAKFVPGGFHGCSHRKERTLYASVSGVKMEVHGEAICEVPTERKVQNTALSR